MTESCHAWTAEPSAWVVRFAGLIAPGGTVLDLACGEGRHARHLAALGLRVESVDRDVVALGAVGSLVLWAEEIRKLIVRRRARRLPDGAPAAIRDLVRDGVFDEASAIRAGKAVLRDNARRLYGF